MTTTVDAAIERGRKLAAATEAHPERHRMLSGDRPTGDLHIGHYLSSLRNRVALQDKGVESFVVIADYQVIADRDSVGPITANALSLLTDYLAAVSIRLGRSISPTQQSRRLTSWGCRSSAWRRTWSCSATRPSRTRSKRVSDRCQRSTHLPGSPGRGHLALQG